MPKHPDSFFIVHRWFDGIRNPRWGDLTDGPATKGEAIDRVLDSFRDFPPTEGTLRVWHFDEDAVRDVTEEFVLEWECANAPDEDELIEQARCDRADEWVKYQRENAA